MDIFGISNVMLGISIYIQGILETCGFATW